MGQAGPNGLGIRVCAGAGADSPFASVYSAFACTLAAYLRRRIMNEL